MLLAALSMTPALIASPAAAHEPSTETSVEVEGAMTITMVARISGPAANAVFQANPDGTLLINYASYGWAEIKPDGTQTETSNWRIQLSLWLNGGTPLDFKDSVAENIELLITPGQSLPVKWGTDLFKKHVTDAGGHTALHRTNVANIEGTYQPRGHEHAHSFTIGTP